jgi:hypothetical protein
MAAEEHGWELLEARDPQEVCERAGVSYSAEEGYSLLVFGSSVKVVPGARTIVGSSAESQLVLAKTAYFTRLSILHYLLSVKRLEPSGRLVGPLELKAGQFFADGSHRLPLDKVAVRFSDDPDGFAQQARRFGGQERSHGDVAMELRPFPRLPVTLVFWRQDEEFPARAYLLFDDTCEQQLPVDILWSVAMACSIVMMLP